MDDLDQTTDDVPKLRPLRLFLTGLLCTVPVAVFLHEYGLALALLTLGGIGIFLLKRIRHCMCTNSLEIIRKREAVIGLRIAVTVSALGFFLFVLPRHHRSSFPRSSSNEAAAIATLRNIGAAQTQCQSSVAFDRDGDGVGEYAYLAELAGGEVSRQMVPPTLSRAFTRVTTQSGITGGVVTRSGYLFQVFLPDSAGRGIPEADTGGIGTVSPDSDRAEREWCCYAWPSSLGISGKRTFFINQDGEVMRTKHKTKRYSGSTSVPSFDAAFVKRSRAGLASSIAANTSGRDNSFWIVIN